MEALSHFDKLVIHASKENWCYTLYCGACGNMHFRNGMEIIGQGKNPLKQVDHLTEIGLMWHDEAETLAERSLNLSGQVINANVARYYRDCSGFNWLGFMGLALWRFENLQPANLGQDYLGELRRENRELIIKLISASWSKKFIELLRGLELTHEAEAAMMVCKDIMHRRREQLQIQDLETMERAFLTLRPNDVP